MDEVPLSQRPLLALDDEKRLPGQHEKIFLVGFPVVHADRLTRPEHVEEDPDLRKLDLTLAVADRRPALAMPPARVAGVQDEPSLAGGHEPGLGLFERGLR